MDTKQMRAEIESLNQNPSSMYEGQLLLSELNEIEKKLGFLKVKIEESKKK